MPGRKTRTAHKPASEQFKFTLQRMFTTRNIIHLLDFGDSMYKLEFLPIHQKLMVNPPG